MTATIQTLFEEAARRDPAAAAIATPDLSVGYGELLGISEQLASVLDDAGIAGRRVGVLLPNDVAYPAVLHALFRSGCSALLLNPANSPRELAEQVEDAGVSQAVTISTFADRLPAGTKLLLVETSVEGGGFGVTLAPAASPHRERDAVGAGDPLPDDEAVVIFTSGMDGRPRGAPLTHRNLAANVRSTAQALGLDRSDRMLAALPFAHGFGLTVCLNAVLTTGATVLPMPRFSPNLALDWMESLGATIVAGVPAMYLGLIGAAEKRGVPRHSLRVALCGGAPLTRGLQRRWEELFGLPLRQGYGLTEASPVCLFNAVDRPNALGTLGTPLPDVEVSIRDALGRELPEGEIGEICVRGENVFGGYLGNSPNHTFWGEWLRTGDLGSLEQGAFHFRGTIKKMFTRNGFNVYPEEIRRVLMSDPRVEEVSVGGRPDPERENEIVLEVRAACDATLTEEDVRALCRDRLASYKQPTRVRVTS